MTRRGFTLIETLVVISIITLLASLTISGLWRARELAKRTQCASNLRQISLGFGCYANANGGINVPMNSVCYQYDDPETNEKWYTNLLDDAECLGERANFIEPNVGHVRWSRESIWTCPSVDSEHKGWGNGYGLNEWRAHRYVCNGGRVDFSAIPAGVFSIADAREKVNGRWVPAFGIHPPCGEGITPWDKGGKQPAPRHLGKANVAFFDGAVDAYTLERFRAKCRKLFWLPKGSAGCNCEMSDPPSS